MSAASTAPAGPAPSGEHPAGHDQDVPGGVVHALPADLREALTADAAVLAAWRDITPLARNEFICWVDDAKQALAPLPDSVVKTSLEGFADYVVERSA